jgi:hypothetical protein
MLALKPHIESLLLEHECVIIPGFGGFIAEMQPAGYHVGSKRFYPPYKAINFNHKLTHNDGLLCQQIMKTTGTDFAGAKWFIDDAVNEFKSKLAVKPQVISGIGEFTLTENGRISFRQSNQTSFCKAAYGLGGFYFPEIAVQVDDTHVNSVEPRVIPMQRSLMRYVSTVAAVIAMFLFVLPTSVHDKKMETATLVPLFDTVIKTPVTTSKPDTAFVALNTPENSEVADIEQNNPVPEVAEVEVVMLPEKQYHIIIGSLPSKQLAMDFVNRKCKGFFTEYTIIESNGRFRVSIKTFNSKEDALPFLDEIRNQNTLFADAWLLGVKTSI